MRRVHLFWLLVLAAGLAAMAALARSGSMPLLQTAGPIAAGERHVILFTLALSSTIVVPVFFLLFYFAWRYHAKVPDAHIHHRPNWDHDTAWTEFAWWIPPAVIISILAVLAWQSSHALDPYMPLPGTPLQVQVVALDWKWLFIYPQLGIATINELDIPVGRPVHFSLTADAPMNSFWIPSLGGQIMVMPGMETQLNLAADTEGTFDGFSGNLSGAGFSGMTFKVHAMPQPQFDAWQKTMQAAGAGKLDAQSYAAIAQPSTNEPVRFYSMTDPGLYTSIYAKYAATSSAATHL